MSLAPAGLHAVPARDAARSRRPALARSRPVRPVLRALQPDAVHPAVPRRLRPGAVRPRGAAHLGVADPGPPRVSATPPAWRSPPARWARAWPPRSAWRWPPAASAACSTPTPRRAASPFDHYIYVIASDGDIEEGVTSEASSLAGTQQLGNLIVFYDDNQISIEDDTDIALSEDVAARYEAYGWHVQEVDGAARDGIGYRRGRPGPDEALRGRQGRDRQAVVHRPAHDHRLAGADQDEHRRRRTAPRSATTRSPPPRRSSASTRTRTSTSSDEVHRPHPRAGRARQGSARRLGRGRFDAWADRQARAQDAARPAARPGAARGLGRRAADLGGRPRTWPPARPPARCSTRWRPMLPELWGGSADLAESNNTTMKGETSFVPAVHSTDDCAPGDPYGRTLHFGIREHAMGAILSGHRAARRRPAPTAAPSCSSATTCAAPSGWRR